MIAFVLVLCLGCVNADIDKKEAGGMRFGKNITVRVMENEEIDFRYLQKVLDGEIKKVAPYFNLWNKEDLKKLIEYMKTNNYVIVSGEYTFNQSWSFEEGAFVTNGGEKLEILKFCAKTAR
jgi:uncharacterized protein with ACT and thioredoxin-like domain